MSLISLRRRAAPMAIVTLISFLLMLLAPLSALAQSAPPPSPTDPIFGGTGGPATLTAPAQDAPDGQRDAPDLVTPAAQTTVDLSTGAAMASFAFRLPRARGVAQPSLALTYNSQSPGAVGFAGTGWTLKLPSITRRGAAGMPLFRDDVFTQPPAALANSTATFDEYLVDGQLLVPLGPVGNAVLLPGEIMPASLAGVSVTGWMYFRREVDDGARYFFKPDGQTWIKQEKSGVITQFGRPIDGWAIPNTNSDGAERPAPWTNFAAPPTPNAVYRWNIVRQTDATGLNTVYYGWTDNSAMIQTATGQAPTLPGTLYLSDIYDTLGVGQALNVANFAHHVHLAWQLPYSVGPVWSPSPNPDSLTAGVSTTPALQTVDPIWRAPPIARLQTVDVTSASWTNSPATRALVRRYSLAYQTNTLNTVTRLIAITLEGQCQSAVPEGAGNLVPNPSGCSPPPTLTLSQYTYYPDGDGSLASPTVAFNDSGATNATPPPRAFEDLNGDGAAELVASFDYRNIQSFLGPSTSLADPTIGELSTIWSLQNCTTYLGSQYCRPWFPFMSGDWLANGSLNFLTFDPQLLWQAYTPVGSTFAGAPVPRLGVGQYDARHAIDVDGDGLVDQSFSGAIGGLTTNALVSQRAHDGSILPFALATPLYNWVAPPTQQRWRRVADMDGDGLPDIVTVDNFECLGAPCPGIGNRVRLNVWPNRGDGTFGFYGLAPTFGNEMSSYYGLLGCSGTGSGTVCQGGGAPGVAEPSIYGDFIIADINGDGLADFVTLGDDSAANAGRLCVHYRQNRLLSQMQFSSFNAPSCTSLPTLGTGCPSHVNYARSTLAVADIDGTGVPRILVSRYFIATPSLGTGYPPGDGTHDCYDLQVFSTTGSPGSAPALGAPTTSTAAGLLHTVTLLGGEQQTVNYQPVRSLSNVNGVVPVAVWAATSLQTTNGLPCTSSQSKTSVVNYQYSTPVYDPRDKMFVGFQSVEEAHTAIPSGSCGGAVPEGGAPGLDRTTFFATTACGPSSGVSCIGQVDYGWFRALRGVVVAVQDAALGTPPVRTTINTYQEHAPYTGLDGRVVRRLPLQRQQTFDWDGPAPSQSQVQPFLHLGNSTYEQYSSGRTFGVTVPQSTPTPSRVVQTDEDDFGNPLDTIDFGQPGFDQPIRTELSWNLFGDPTGWGYRTTSRRVGYADPVTGTSFQSQIRSYSYVYNSLGQLITETGALPDEPPTMGAAGGPNPTFGAGAPPDATTGTQVCIVGCASGGTTGVQYDAFGNPTVTPRANNRCSQVNYDPAFAQFPQTTTSYLGGCGSTNPPPMLGATSYDRGFERVTHQSIIAGGVPRTTITGLDAFGRVVEVDQPDAAPGMTDQYAALRLLYYDNGPIRTILSTTVDNTMTVPSESGGTVTVMGYQGHMRFVDGYGDTIAVFDEQSQLSSGEAEFIVSGAHVRYGNGLIKQTVAPAFTVGPTITLGVTNVTNFLSDVYLSLGPSTTRTYDGAGRVLSSTDPNGFSTLYTYHFGTSASSQGPGASALTICDPEQSQSGGTHGGSFTTMVTDGHGRNVLTRKQLNNASSGAGYLLTLPTYAATGEVIGLEQLFPSGSYNRTMTYDSLGRMVSQAEPNTGTWTYAYNDSGDLVGIMDARGCGKVIYHDGLGRTVAEDYSPCASSDPAWTYTGPPNLTTGDNTEAFYVYDGFGQLQTVLDRAGSRTNSYDGRGRLIAMQRQIAVPGSAGKISARYAPTIYTKGPLQYSESNRLLVAPTGADLADFQVNSSAYGPSALAIGYDLAGRVTSVASSYGPLVASRSSDASDRALQETFGDFAGTAANMGYDNGGRLIGYTIGRKPGPWAGYASGGTSSAENTFEGVLASAAITYDMVGNPRSINQSATDGGVKTAEGYTTLPRVDITWPTGAEPALSRTFTYWDDYRLAQATASYYVPGSTTGGPDSFAPTLDTSPYGAPPDGNSYQPSNSRPTRVQQLNYSYDWRGNITNSIDDVSDYFDRSIGVARLGGSSSRPDALFSANDIYENGTYSFGGLALTYDAAGNATSLRTHGSTPVPAHTYIYQYTWDEMGRLSGASRALLATVQVAESYTYDAGGQRVSIAGPGGTTVNVFDSLVLKNATFANGDYQHGDSTEQVYLNAGGSMLGRVVYATGLPSASSSTLGNLHVFMSLPDPLGSTSFVIDHDTSEVMEAMTYLPYGGVESDYRPARWNYDREDVRYTSHWDNAEVGLVYMGARYYSPQLGRFISPDPLAIQTAKGDLNPYAYGHGSPFRNVDPTGLDDCDRNFSSCSDQLDSVQVTQAGAAAVVTEAAATTTEGSGVFAAGTFGTQTAGTSGAIAPGGAVGPAGGTVVLGQAALGVGTVGVGTALGYLAFQDLFSAHAPADESPEEGGSQQPPVVTFDYTQYPQLADNIWQAQQAGYPTVLHYNGGSPLNGENRSNALFEHNQNGVQGPPGFNRDEYPFATTFEGGAGAWVGWIPWQQNAAQGGILNSFYNLNQLGISDPFGVAVINHP